MPVLPLPRLRRRTAVYARIETTRGTLIAMTSAHAKLLTYDVSIDQNIEMVVRRPNGISAGKFAGIPAEYLGRMSMRHELKGSGSANTLPWWASTFLIACGFEETASGSGILVPISAPEDQQTISIGVNRDGLLKQLAGAMGTFNLEYVNGRAAFINFDMMGVWQDPTDAAFPTDIAHESTLPPRVASATFTVGGTTRNISRLSIAQNNTVAMRKTFENEAALLHAIVTERDPVGSIDPEANLVADHDVFGQFKTSTEAALVLDIGATNGNKVQIDAPKLQYMDPKEGDREGMLTHDIAFGLNEPNSGDGYLTFAFP